MHRMMWGKVYYVEVSLVYVEGIGRRVIFVGEERERESGGDSRANLTSYFRGGASTE